MSNTTIVKERPRSSISVEDQWNVAALYPSLEKWEEQYTRCVESTSSPHWPSLSLYRGRLKENPNLLKDALEAIFKVSRTLEKLYAYAHLRHDEEITLEASKNAFQRISSLLYDFQQETAWVEPEILSLPGNVIEEFLHSLVLGPYRFHLEKILRMRPHTLSADKEELLAMAGKPLQAPPKAFSALNNADLIFGNVKDEKGQEHPLSHGSYQVFLHSADRVLRKNAFCQMHEKYKEFENTLAELLYGEMQSHAFFAQARNFSTCLDAALYPKNIDPSVYHSLIQAVHKEGTRALHRYMKVRKKQLRVSELHLYDLHVPMVPHVDIRMEYDEAEALVIESVAPLGSEYQNLLRKGLKQEQWVDRFENKNKRSGAYSSGCYDSFPYILMNFKGLLRDTFTLAHEAGHSMHSLLSKQHQPYHYSHYPIFVAEVASTFNEELLMHLLLKTRTKKEEKLFLINEKIEDIRTTLLRQTLFAEFELKIHSLVEEGSPLTPTLLKELYRQLNVEYYGPHVVVDPEIAIEWARIPHFYYNYYVFQYATGISAALALSQKVLSGETEAQKHYLSFLKGGCSKFPLDLLKMAGVDMTTPEPILSALRTFDSLLTDFETLSQKD